MGWGSLCAATLALGAVGADAGPGFKPPEAQTPSFNEQTEPALLFDRIVAWVDGETVGQNELFAESWLARIEADGEAALAQPPDEAALQHDLSLLVGDLLVAREARRIGAEAAPTELVEQRLAQLLDKFPSQNAYAAFVHRLGVDDHFVLDSIARRLFVERYLTQRLRTRLGPEWGPAPALGASKRAAAAREQRLAELALAYRQELWRSVPIRLLRPGGALERVSSER